MPREQSPGINQKIDTDARKLMEGSLDTLAIKKRPTIIDLPGLGPNFTDEELWEWVKKEIGPLDGEEQPDLLVDPEEQSRKLEDLYKTLDKAYQDAKVFLQATLKYNPGEVHVTSPGRLKTKEDVIRLLRNIRSVKGETGGLDQSAKYCRLVKTTKAFFETKKHDADFLKSITGHFENSLVSNNVQENGKRTPLTFMDNAERGMQFMVLDSDGSFVIDGVLSSRPKEIRGAVLRFLIRPESNAATALADGIGVEIIIEKDKALRLIPILQEWLISRMKMDRVDIQNESYLTRKQMNKLKDELSRRFPPDSFNLYDGKPNRVSAGSFQVLKIKGTLEFSDEDAALVFRDQEGTPKLPMDVSIHARAFEIQLVMPENKNEEEESNHNIYDAKKYIAARTRLDGWCPQSAFDEIVEEAYRKSNISPTNIRHYLLGKPYSPVIEVREDGKLKYYALSVCERLKELGFMSKARLAELEAARANGQKKYKKKK